MYVNITDHVFTADHAERLAVSFCDKELTYNDLDVYSDNIAAYIKNRFGSGKEAVGLFISGSLNFCTGLFSILKAEKAVVPINVGSKAEEIERLVRYLGIRLFISDSTAYEKLIAITERDFGIIILDEQGSFEYIGTTDSISKDYSDPELDDVAVILHTSGSLSTPKSVMLTHRNIINSAKAIGDDLAITAEDRSLIILPVYYASALIGQLFAHMFKGAAVFFTNKILSPKAIFMNIGKYRITDFSMVPGLMNETEAMLGRLERYDVASLRYICVSGGAVQGKRANHLANAYPKVQIIRTYGLTETSTRVSHYRQPMDTVTDTCAGKTLTDCTVEVRKLGEDTPYGDIYVKGDNIMKGYYKRSNDNDRVLSNGWLNTGDVGFIDEYGQLHVVGRKKNIIIRNGENIYPEEIEEVICGFDTVKEAYVYGVEDDILGEVPAADVVLFEGARFDENELMEYCRSKMTGSKVPVKYNVTDEIPKTSNGKIKRRKDIVTWKKS